jgi:hypothetical protein
MGHLPFLGGDYTLWARIWFVAYQYDRAARKFGPTANFFDLVDSLLRPFQRLLVRYWIYNNETIVGDNKVAEQRGEGALINRKKWVRFWGKRSKTFVTKVDHY